MPGPLLLLFYKELREPRYSGFQQMENPFEPCFIIGGFIFRRQEKLKNFPRERKKTQYQQRLRFKPESSLENHFLLSPSLGF